MFTMAHLLFWCSDDTLMMYLKLDRPPAIYHKMCSKTNKVIFKIVLVQNIWWHHGQRYKGLNHLKPLKFDPKYQQKIFERKISVDWMDRRKQFCYFRWEDTKIWIRVWVLAAIHLWLAQAFNDAFVVSGVCIVERGKGFWAVWWSSGQRACLPFRWSQFASSWNLQFLLCKLIKKNENKQKRLWMAHSRRRWSFILILHRKRGN